MACTLYIDNYGSINSWENCVRVALESAGEISIMYNNGSDNDSYFYSRGYVYYNGSEINEGWSWRDDDTTSEITITISDKIEKPSNPGGSGGGTNDRVEDPDDIDPDTTTPATTTIRYFFKSTGDPADYNSGYTNVVNGTSVNAVTISHYGMTLVAGQTYVKTLTYYENNNGTLVPRSYEITSPVSGYLLYNIVSTPALSTHEEYIKTDYDIKVYCFKAPTITVAYTSTPDTLFGTPPASINVLPNVGKVGSFTADWGMIGGMVVTTTISNIKSGYNFKWWDIKIGDTTTRDYGSGSNKEYRYTVDKFDNVTITANFERLPAVTTQIDPSGAGTTTPTAGTITPTATNYQITLKATPNDGYVFKNWSKSGTNLSESTSYTYKASSGENVTIKANFEKIPDPGSEDIEIPTGYENKIATNSDIKNYILNVYSNEDNQCPTKSQIKTYGGNAISFNGSYSDTQCVKYTDIYLGGENKTCKIYVYVYSGNNRKAETFHLYRGDILMKSGSFDITTKDKVGFAEVISYKFGATLNDNTIKIKIGSFTGTCSVYSYFGENITSVSDKSIFISNGKSLGILDNNKTKTFDTGTTWNEWIKGNKQLVISLDFKNNDK